MLGGKFKVADESDDLGENRDDRKEKQKSSTTESEDKILDDIAGPDVSKPSPSDDVRKIPQDEAKGIADALKSQAPDLQKAHHEEDIGDTDVDKMEQEEEKESEKQ